MSFLSYCTALHQADRKRQAETKKAHLAREAELEKEEYEAVLRRGVNERGGGEGRDYSQHLLLYAPHNPLDPFECIRNHIQ